MGGTLISFDNYFVAIYLELIRLRVSFQGFETSDYFLLLNFEVM